MNTGSPHTTDVHVIPTDSRWEIRRHGDRYPTARHRTRWAAIKHARVLALQSGTILFVHRRNGTIDIDSAVADHWASIQNML